MMSYVFQAIRAMFFSLDKIIYGLIDDVYSLLLLITRTSIFSENVIADFASRIYALAGIFMLFKVSLSIIHYVINPDDFVDKEKGFASVGKRIVISLVLLVLTPYIFHEAYGLQALILEDNTIFNLVFGSEMIDDVPRIDYVQNAGKHIQFVTMYSFMRPNFAEWYGDNTFDLAPCQETYVYNYVDGKRVGIKRRDNPGGGTSAFIYELVPDCFGEYSSSSDTYSTTSPSGNTLAAAFSHSDVSMPQLYQTYAQGVAQRNFGLLMRQDIVLAKINVQGKGDRYLIDYKYFVSTAVGIIIVYIFVLFCIDIAVRSIKLGFLEMIAPVPILSYIDPKSGKDGMFKKWYQMCISTYMSLFLRLFALYLGIYVITVIGGYYDFITGEQIKGNWLLNIFMILGVLIFAKQLPKIIEDIFGIKMDGKFTLNPFKKIENEALGGKAIAGASRGVIGGALGGLASGSPFGLAGGALTGLRRGLHGDVKGVGDARQKAIQDRANLRSARLQGSTWHGRLGAATSSLLGTGGEMARIEKEKVQLQDKIDDQKKYKEQVEARIADRQRRIKNQTATQSAISAVQDRATAKIKEGKGAQGAVYQQMMRNAEQARQTGNGALAAQLEQAATKYAHSTGRDEYMNEVRRGTVGPRSTQTIGGVAYTAAGAATTDVRLQDLNTSYEAAARVSGHTIETDAGRMDTQGNTINRTIATDKAAIAPDEQKILEHTDTIKDLTVDMQDISRREAAAKANQSAVGAGGKK